MILTACGKNRDKAAPTPESAFFTAQKAFCTVEDNGKDKSNIVERYNEVFVFQGDQVTVKSFDLDPQRHLQLNSKSQPKLKNVEIAYFRAQNGSLYFTADQERKAKYKIICRDFDGKKQNCFQLMGTYQTTHCPCALPEAI